MLVIMREIIAEGIIPRILSAILHNIFLVSHNLGYNRVTLEKLYSTTMRRISRTTLTLKMYIGLRLAIAKSEALIINLILNIFLRPW
jgi:hypothetical protein